MKKPTGGKSIGTRRVIPWHFNNPGQHSSASMQVGYICSYTFSTAMDDSIHAAAVSLNVHTLKTKQCEAVEAFMKGNDVFVALPTGYRKSPFCGI